MKKRRDFFWPRETTVEHFWVVAKTLLSRNIHTGLYKPERSHPGFYRVILEPHIRSSIQKCGQFTERQRSRKGSDAIESIQQLANDGIDHRD